jgi:hypothetical protein
VPTQSRRRPIGVTILSLTAFAVSPMFVIVLGRAFSVIHTKSELPSVVEDLIPFVYLCALLLLSSACFLTLAWISFTAGLDLWRMNERGRYLASFSMILFLLVGIINLLMNDIWSTLSGVGLCIFGVVFFAYLQVPSIRQRFRRPPPELRG